MGGMPPTVSPRRAWSAVLRRDRALDGAFVFAVSTTGIYCRPSCPARRPLRRHVSFYATSTEAERAGYRACLRCRPTVVPDPAQAWTDLVRRLLDAAAHAGDPAPTLSALAREVGVSASHLQRTFKARVGLSPAEYARAARVARFRRAARSGGVLDAAFAAGYGSSRALYDDARRLGLTPAAYRRGGRGVHIAYTIVAGLGGHVLVAASARGVVRVDLGSSKRGLATALARDLPSAEIVRDDRGLAPLARVVLRAARGAPVEVPLDLRGTALQLRVWRALRAVPSGETRSYGELARDAGAPRAVRAVARACGANPVAVLVPCHRAVAKDGALTGYRWGLERKAALLAAERRRSSRRVTALR